VNVGTEGHIDQGPKLTEEDFIMIDYFINDEGDITRWIAWEEKKPLIEAQIPELIYLINQADQATNALKRYAKYLVDQDVQGGEE